MYGHLATPAGGAYWTPRGWYIDKTDSKITVANHTALQPTTAISIIVWVYQIAWNGNARIAVKNDGTDYGLVFDATNTRFTFNINGGARQNPTVGTITTGVWYMLAGTYDSAIVNAFINGILVNAASGAYATAINTSATDLCIGGRTADNAANVDGYIGEVQIYSRCLNPQEIQNNYLATKFRYR